MGWRLGTRSWGWELGWGLGGGVAAVTPSGSRQLIAIHEDDVKSSLYYIDIHVLSSQSSRLMRSCETFEAGGKKAVFHHAGFRIFQAQF